MDCLKAFGYVMLIGLTDLGALSKKWDTIPTLWPNAIVPFKISKSIRMVDSKKILQAAMAEIETTSCIRFVERKDEHDFLDISAGLDCATPIGHQGQAQVLVLQIPFCLERRKILRQLLHTLGLPMEHLRMDRDEHIKVNWGNMATADTPFFAKQNTSALPLQALPYDYNSILHPDANYHALNSTFPTLVPLQAEATLGKATGLSPLDVLKLNRLYC